VQSHFEVAARGEELVVGGGGEEVGLRGEDAAGGFVAGGVGGLVGRGWGKDGVEDERWCAYR